MSTGSRVLVYTNEDVEKVFYSVERWHEVLNKELGRLVGGSTDPNCVSWQEFWPGKTSTLFRPIQNLQDFLQHAYGVRSKLLLVAVVLSSVGDADLEGVRSFSGEATIPSVLFSLESSQCIGIPPWLRCVWNGT